MLLPEHVTLLDAIAAGARAQNAEAGLIFCDSDTHHQFISMAELLAGSLCYAAALRAYGVEQGERILLMVPTSAEYVYAFLGLMALGAVPCSLAPPVAAGAPSVSVVARYLASRRLITTAPLAAAIAPAGAALDAADVLQIITTGELAAQARVAQPVTPAVLGSDDLALIQCTSGSTGQPKGVLITHGNLVSNLMSSGQALGITARDALVGWLPLYHDMGLIGCLCLPLYWNIRGVLLSPQRFLRRPVSWLQAIARHGGTISPAPNFAYSQAAARIADSELAGLDLSSWRAALCGAEPIHADTLTRFQDRFACAGLPANALMPCYGLAEATLAVSFHPAGTPLVIDRLSREALARSEVKQASAGSDAVVVVSSGRPATGTEVRIVGADGNTLPDNRIGRVYVRSASVMAGYHDLPAAEAAALRQGWLDTGDLGYLCDGALRITGRSKDMIIIRGRNYAPSDFEWAAEEVPGVRRGKVVAFGVFSPVQGTEELCLLCEAEHVNEEARPALIRAVRAHVAEKTGVVPAVVQLIPKGSVMTTTSGKLQRQRLKAAYLAAQPTQA